MRVIEILHNPNCVEVDTRIFHDLTPPQPVAQVCLEQESGTARWYAVTGWTAAGTPCPAFVQKVDDSGDGVALLVYGGDAGVRLQPVERNAPWRLGDLEQWGEPFLIIGDLSDIRHG